MSSWPGVLHNIIFYIDAFTDRSGRLLAWFTLAMALLTAFVVVSRYGFNTGSILAQESVNYLHGCMFMLGAAYALKHDAHVRVDIFYRAFSPRKQAWVNSLGGIVFLLPLCLFVVASSWDFVSESWSIKEVSVEPGGIPAVYLLKSLIPLMAINLMIQGVAEILRNTLVLIESDT